MSIVDTNSEKTPAEQIKEQLVNPRASNKVNIDTSFEFTPQNPFTIDGNENKNENIAYPGFPVEEEKPGFARVALEEFKELSTNVHALHAASNKQSAEGRASAEARYFIPESYLDKQFINKPTPNGWTPKEEIEKLSDANKKFIPRLLDAKSPQDFQYRLNDMLQQEEHDKILENGNWFAKLVGGLVGLSPIGSIENFIPIAGVATKAKVSSSFFNAMVKSYPGVLAASAIREGAMQMDKQDGNLGDFVKDTFVDSAFGTVFFGGLSGASSLLNVSEFNRLKEFSKKYLKGIGFEYIVSKEGELTGFKAIDTTGGSVSAAEVTKAQEMADSAFYKGGLFKIPYVGKGALHLLSGNIPGISYFTGSPLVTLLTSKYKSAAAFANSAFDHFITTEGEAKGGVRTQSFESKVKQTSAMLTNLHLQTTAFHAERNGYTIKLRPTIGIQNAFNAAKQKSIEALSEQSNKTNFISKEDFMDEVQQVLHSGEAHENAAVNGLASIYRKVIDDTFKDYRAAHNLPEDWLPPKTATQYLMRVYDTSYLQTHEGEKSFISTVSNWLRQSDEQIAEHMRPINEAKEAIKAQKESHEALIKSGKATDEQITLSARTTESLERHARKLENDLTNRMRTDENLFIHVDDSNALSANEAKQIKVLQKPIAKKQEVVDKIQREVEQLRQKSFFEKGKAHKARTAEKAESKLESAEEHKKLLDAKIEELRIAKDEVLEQERILQDKIANGEVRQNLYNRIPESQQYKLKDHNNRLKFRETYESDFHRTTAARAYLDSILHLKPEDVIADVFGKLTGNISENALKKRTLPVPDEILYRNNFMTKDLYAKTANYVNYLSRRTHLKTSFANVTVNGGFDELAESLLGEYKENRALISGRIERLQESAKDAKPEQKAKIEKEIAKEKRNLGKEVKDFENIKKTMKTLYENRMMGLNKGSDFDNMARKVIMSIGAAANLHNLPATQITDLAFVGFQHGIWNFVRDGVYPLITFMSKNSEAMRETAPHLNLGLQDMLNHYADRNWSMEMQPYINMGKIVSGVQKFAHFSALTDLSPYIDNGIQHVAGSVIQSRFMELLHKSVEGALTEKESLYLRKYGIDPKKWGDRMVNAFKDAEGFKTEVGGYVSKFWQWQDLEASNEFSRAVFRGIQNTLVWKGMADSPFFADNALGMFFHTFTGWGYAATNRYLIPSLQHPDGALLLKMAWMGSAGALVSPTRRMSRGEEAWPDDMTDAQRAYEAFSDSGVFSNVSNVLNMANLLSSDKLLGDLKNDKFRNRAITGLFGMSDVLSSTASRISDVLRMAAHNEWNEKDMKTAAHMLPITGAMYGHYISDKFIESRGLPRNRRAAESE